MNAFHTNALDINVVEVTIRPARADDVDKLAQLDAAAWPSGSNPYPAAATPFGARFGLADLAVAVVERTLIGFVAAGPRSRLASNSHVASVRSLLVAPCVRRAGLGEALLAFAERRAAQRGFEKLDASVLSSNAASLALFAKAGFVEEGRLRGEFRIASKLVDDILLGKFLRHADRSNPVAHPPAWLA
jgi:ribosomal protein S18 acetylase RimI-like enzyme